VSDRAFAWLLLGVALLARVGVGGAVPHDPVWDGVFYHEGALSLARGEGYSKPGSHHDERLIPRSHYPVGYSVLLAGAYTLFGPGQGSALLANALVGTLIPLLGFGLARRSLNRGRARVAGIVLALHPGLLLYGAIEMTELLAACLVLLSAYCAMTWGGRAWGVAATGVAVGLSILVRPQSLLVAPLLTLVFRGNKRQRLQRGGVACLVGLMFVAPWTLRNCRALGSCAFVSTNGGWNLAIGALTADGGYRTLGPTDGCSGSLGPVAEDSCWAKLALKTIASDPLHWLSLAPGKLRHTYDYEAFAVAYLAEAHPITWPAARRRFAMSFTSQLHHLLVFAAALSAVAFFWPREWRRHSAQAALITLLLGFELFARCTAARPLYWVAVALPVLGWWRLPRAPARIPLLEYLWGWLAITSLTHVLFFGSDRYHMVITPALCVLAAAALRRPETSGRPHQGA
jgi:4-amino-4-deoxy-L-arabinose transferase-like glycosyltransferase